MNDRDRGDGEILELKCSCGFNGIGFDIAFVGIGGEECPVENTFDLVHALGGGVERERIITVPAKGSEFIKARDVVKVCMGVEHGIDLGDVFPECLFSEVWTCVDE